MVDNKKVVFVDIDKTLCTLAEMKDGKPDYTTCKPIKENINIINTMFDDGHTIVLWTSRNIKFNHQPKYKEITKKSLEEWNVKYHEILFEKPYYDIFIDDKALNVKDLKGDILNEF